MSLHRSVTVPISEEAHRELEAIHAAFPELKRAAIARACLEAGLPIIAKRFRPRRTKGAPKA